MKLNIFNQYENDSNIVIEFLKKHQIKVTGTTIDETLQHHPDYPSILSISDSLKKWGVNNVTIKVEPEKLAELPFPCIVHAKNESFIILDAVDQNQVHYTNGKGKTASMPLEDFLEKWSGVVLLAEAEEHTGEKNYKANVWKERATALFSLGLLALPFILGIFAIANSALFGISEHYIWGFSLLIFLKAFGVVVSVFLLWYEIDKSNPLLQRICTTGRKVNCNAILSSRMSQIFSWLSWSEVGFFYFAGGLLALLFAGSQTSSVLLVLACINILVLPYTIWSVLYQWRVAKQWCMLCLTVQFILVAEFFVAWQSGILGTLQFSNDFLIEIIPSFLIPLAPAFLLPVAIWYAVKPQLLAAQQGKRDFRRLQRIKYNPDVFQALLQKQKQVPSYTKGLGITLGNPQAKIHLVKVCNPYCAPCADAHKLIDELKDTGLVSVEIIFTVTNEEKDFRALPVKHLLAIAERNDEILTQKALDDWYSSVRTVQKNYEVFAAQYPVSKEELDKQASKINGMKKWCDDVEIAYTPTIFINGHQLPDAYWIDDLKYFLEE